MSISFLARRAWVAVLALVLCPPAALAARLDQTTIGNGVVAVDFTGTDAGQGGSNLRLTSMGRWLDSRDADRYTIWRLRNNGTTARDVRLEGYLTSFGVALTLRPRSDTYVRSPIVEGTATHRLHEGTMRIASIGASNAAWSNAAAVPIAPGPNRPPRFVGLPELAAQVDVLYRYPVLIEDPDGDMVSLSVLAAPSGYGFDTVAGSFRFLASARQLGIHPVTVAANDGRGGSATQAHELRVQADFCAVLPIALPKTRVGSASPGQAFSKLAGGGGAHQFAWLSWSGATTPVILAHSLAAPGDSQDYADPDDPGDRHLDIEDWVRSTGAGSMDHPDVRAALNALLYREMVVPEWRESRSTSGAPEYWITRFSRVQLTGFDLAGAGTLSFTYHGDADCYADPPVSTDQVLRTPRDTALDFTLQALDPDGDEITYYVTHDPAHGVLSGAPPALRYTPAAGFVGLDRVLYKAVADGLKSETGEVKITVTDGIPVNQRPVATPQTLSVAENVSLAIVLSGSDPDGDLLAYALQTAPAHGSLSGTAPNLVYSPDANYDGPDVFTFTVADALSMSAPATISITVLPVNRPPQIVGPPVTSVPESAAYSYDVDATDPDVADLLTYSLDLSPSASSILPATGLISWNPTSALVSGVRIPNRMCRRPSSEIGTFQPRVKWHWNEFDVLSQPAVAPLTDTNGDGLVTAADDPVVLFVRWYSDCARTTVHALDGKTGSELWRFGGLGGIGSGSHVAVADLEGDGLPEVVAMLADGGVVALTNTGQVKWSSTEPRLTSCYVQGAATIADLEGDGQAEVLARGAVLNSDGSLRFLNPNLWHATIDTAVDLDGDGIQEVLSLDRAFRSDGTELWRLPDGDTARSMIPVNVDGDPQPEIAYVGRHVGLVDHRGQRIWRFSNTTSYNVTPLTAGDLDGDGRTDLVALLNGQLRAFRAHDGSTMWTGQVDEPSHMTGAVIFDFEGDGRSEVIYADTTRLRVYEGISGAIRLDVPNYSATATESPTVADVDNDGHADLIVGSDRNETAGIRVIEDLYGSWRRTRPIWNQYQYSIDNIDDSLRAPAHPRESWRAHNTFRTNEMVDSPAAELPDLAVFDLRLLEDGTSNRISAQVVNRGLRAIDRSTTARLFNGPPQAGGTLLGEATLGPITVGGAQTVQFAPVDAGAINRNLWVEVDPSNSLIECIESNNHSTGVLFDARVTDSGGLHDTQRWTASVEDVNAAPSVATAELPVAMPGQAFRTLIAIDDPDIGDAHEFSLTQAPSGVSINGVSGELLWYVPLSSLGNHAITVRAVDLAGAVTSRSYTLTVAGNNAPRFISAPRVHGVVGTYYTYGSRAIDLENDSVTYELASAPTGMQIHGLSGNINWTPTPSQAGRHAIVVRARDARGAIGLQSFSVLVLATAANRAPSIISTPGTSAVVGVPYAYDVEGMDPDGDSLRYQLLLSPAGMGMDPITGQIAWTPAQAGSHAVRIRLYDSWGAQALQDYTLVAVVSTNRLPQITSTPFTSAKVGREYRYDVEATDADGDSLTYSLTAAPSGMAIDPANGLIRWTPQAAGGVSPIVRVADARGYAEQQWTLDAVPASTALTVDVQVSPHVVGPGVSLTVAIATTGAAGPVVATLTIGAQSQSVNPNDTTTIAAPTGFGCTPVVVNVADGYESATAEDSFCVADPADTQPPLVALSSPTDEAEITAPVEVRGSISELHLNSWTLAHRPANSPDAVPTVIAEGTDTFNDRVLGQFDPTSLHNGQYALILQATDAGGRTSSDSVVVRVTGDMKVGHFAITFEDASIPVAGIPVRVTRTYDTRQRDESLDFGHGWSVDYQNVRIRESAKLGFSWRIEARGGGFFPQQCAVPNGNRVVTVTLPDGEVETFHARAVPECGEAFTPQTRVQLEFQAIDGTDSTLQQSSYGLLLLATTAGSGVYNLVDPEAPGDPVDPRMYRLTTAEGMVYELDQFLGVRRIVEPNGQSLTYSTAGVTHSSGIGIQFIRDGQGRIQDMVLPDGEVLSYTYTVAGDLESHIDALDHRTTFAYGLTQFPHYLTEITDPRGVRVIRNEYDDDGRLVATIDADGHRIEYDHDIDGRAEQVRDRRGNLQRFVYDDNGWVLAETNALGETTRHTYDSNGSELTRTDALGQTTTWSYDARGNALTETNALGHTTTSSYDGRNSLLTQVDPAGRAVIANTYHPQTGALLGTHDALGHGIAFGYDSGVGSAGNTGELTGMTDALGQATHYELDAGGRGWRVAEVDPLGHRTTYTHDSAGRVLTETRTRTVAVAGGGSAIESLVTRSTYDAKGRLIRTDLPDGAFATIEYNAIDKPVRECDALAHCTTTTYDARGNATRVEHPDGSAESTSYDANGNVTGQTDRAGRLTRMAYDAANRVVETLHPDETPANDADNPRTRNTYDAAGRMTATIDERGHVTTYTYDAANRRTSVTHPPVGAASAATATSYDASGRRTSETDPNGNSTSFIYDAAGRLTETVLADGTRARVEYDALGRKTAEIDPDNRRTEYAYDALGRLSTVTLAAGTPFATVTSYAYDEAGNRITQTDAENRSTRWTFDAAGRERTRTLPLGQSESSTYDVLGNRATHTDFRGRTTGWTHDVLNRPTSIDYPTDPDVATAYAPSGQRASTTDARGITSYAYEPRDRLVRKSDPDGLTIEYRYDPAGNLVSRVSPSQSLVYTYDARNRLETVTRTIDGTAPQLTRYAYDAAGNRSEMIGADGTRTTYQYDARHRLASLTKRTAAAALLVGMSYTVDASGLRTALTESDPAGTTRTVAYTYDALKRLTGETIAHRDPTRNRTSTWTYDRVGNRLTQSVRTAEGTVGAATAATLYTYDANDRLLTEATTLDAGAAHLTTYTYDANGNTIAKATPSGPVDYTYDDANRLVEMRQAGDRTTYAYDPDGLRIGQTRIPATGDPITTRYLQDPTYAYSQVIEQWRKQGTSPTTLEASYAFADDLIAQTRYAGVTATTAHVQMDGFGSVRWLTDAAGAITDSIDYDAFGNEINHRGSTPTEHLYRGEQFDPNLGFYYLRARWMDPKSARFLSKDAFRGIRTDPHSLHKYVYVQNDPANRTDPSGLCDCNLTSVSEANAAGSVLTTSSIPSGMQVAVNNVAGKALESQLLLLVERELPGATVRVGKIIVGQGGRRFYDLLVQFNGRLLIVEAKTRIPLGGAALRRLIGQLLTYSTPQAAELAGAEVVVVSAEAAEVAAASLEHIALQLEAGTSAGFIQGPLEFVHFLRTYFLML